MGSRIGPAARRQAGLQGRPARSLLRRLALLVIAASRSHSNWPSLSTRPSSVRLHARGTRRPRGGDPRIRIAQVPGQARGAEPPRRSCRREARGARPGSAPRRPRPTMATATACPPPPRQGRARISRALCRLPSLRLRFALVPSPRRSPKVGPGCGRPTQASCGAGGKRRPCGAGPTLPARAESHRRPSSPLPAPCPAGPVAARSRTLSPDGLLHMPPRRSPPPVLLLARESWQSSPGTALLSAPRQDRSAERRLPGHGTSARLNRRRDRTRASSRAVSLGRIGEAAPKAWLIAKKQSC